MMQGTVRNVEQLEAVEERYAPVGYDSITTYAEEQKLTTAQLPGDLSGSGEHASGYLQ